MANPTGKGGWTKGESGNPNGRPRKKHALSDLLRVVGGKKPDGQDQPNKRLLAETLWRMAVGGDVSAARLIYEYTDGKPIQRQEIAGPGGSPIPVEITRIIERIYDAGDEPETDDNGD